MGKGWHSGQGTIFGVFHMVLGSWWEISENGDRGSTQNFGADLVSIVVWPGESILEKSPNIKEMPFFKNGHVQKIQKCQFLEKKPPEAQRQRQPGAFQKRPCLKTYLHKINSFLQKSEKVTFSKKSRFWWKFTGQSQKNTENLNGPYGPYEHILQDGSPNLWPKKWVMDKKWWFRIPKKSKIQFRDPKSSFWDWFQVRNDF